MGRIISDIIWQFLFFASSFIFIPMLISRCSWFVGTIVAFIFYWWVFPSGAFYVFRNHQQRISIWVLQRNHIVKSVLVRHKFNSWEKMCLDAWAATLSDEGQEILKDQLSRYKYIEVLGHSSFIRRIFYSRSVREFDHDEPTKVATIIIPLNERHRTQCNIYLCDRELYALGFPKDMKRLMRKFRLSPADLKVEQVITHVKI